MNFITILLQLSGVTDVQVTWPVVECTFAVTAQPRAEVSAVGRGHVSCLTSSSSTSLPAHHVEAPWQTCSPLLVPIQMLLHWKWKARKRFTRFYLQHFLPVLLPLFSKGGTFIRDNHEGHCLLMTHQNVVFNAFNNLIPCCHRNCL